MIDKNHMMAVLIYACPSFAPAWGTFLDEWRDEADNLPLYLALGGLARHLCGMLARGETDQFPEVFAAIERLLIEGDGYVREAACIGLLEDLQNANVHTVTDPEQFRQFLGPEAARCWSELNRFWHGEDTGSDQIGPTNR